MNMRTFVIFALVTLALATAIPSEDQTEDMVVPEMTLAQARDEFDAHAEAVASLEFLQSTEGRTNNACKELADNTLTEISTSITNTQKMLDKMYKGERCHLEGKAALDSAESRKRDADSKLKTANKRLRKAETAQVDFGKYTFSALREGSCGVFFNDGAYVRAKSTYKKRKSEVEKATGAAASAKKARDAAKVAHLEAVKSCQCRVQREHSKAWTSANKNKADNAKAWKKAKHMLCVLTGTPEARCSTSGLKTLSKPRLSSSIKNARCEGVSTMGGALSCHLKKASTTRAGVVKTSGSGTLTGGGMQNRHNKYDAKSGVEQFYPDGNSFNCDTGFGAGSLVCYGVYCTKGGKKLQCQTKSTRVRSQSKRGTAGLSSGYVMTGGGMFNHYRHWNNKGQFEESFPNGNSWSSDMGFGAGDFTSYVRGCKGLSCVTVKSGLGDYTVAKCPSGYTVTGCGTINKVRKMGNLAAFEFVRPSNDLKQCQCNMGFGAGKDYCYARCCK